MLFIQLLVCSALSILLPSNAVKVYTTSCIDRIGSRYVRNGSMCYFSCEIEGLKNGQVWTIEKTHSFHRGLNTEKEVKDPFRLFTGK